MPPVVVSRSGGDRPGVHAREGRWRHRGAGPGERAGAPRWRGGARGSRARRVPVQVPRGRKQRREGRTACGSCSGLTPLLDGRAGRRRRAGDHAACPYRSVVPGRALPGAHRTRTESHRTGRPAPHTTDASLRPLAEPGDRGPGSPTAYIGGPEGDRTRPARAVLGAGNLQAEDLACTLITRPLSRTVRSSRGVPRHSSRTSRGPRRSRSSRAARGSTRRRAGRTPPWRTRPLSPQPTTSRTLLCP